MRKHDEATERLLRTISADQEALRRELRSTRLRKLRRQVSNEIDGAVKITPTQQAPTKAGMGGNIARRS